MNTAHRTIVAAFVATGLSLGVAATAFATSGTDPVPNPSVPSVPSDPADVVGNTKARCDAAIDKRVADLAAWTSRINGLAHLTSDQKTALTTEMAGVSNGLVTVAKPAVDNATDRASLRAACRSIVVDYRVYLVVHPQVFITAGADTELAAIAKLQDFSATLKAKGADTSAVDALLAQAQTTAAAVPGHVSGITPSSYNADPAGTRAVFRSARHDLVSVRLELRQARAMLRQLNRGLH